MRILKQLIYGSIYLSILAIVVAGAYRITLYDAPTCFDNIQNQEETAVDCDGTCISCVLKNAKLDTVEPIFLPAGENRLTILTEVVNQGEIGAIFEYQIDILGILGLIRTSINGVSSIAPMSKKSIVIPGVNLNPVDVDSATIEILEIKWDLEGEATFHFVETHSVETQIIEDEIIVIGKVTNLSGGIVNVVRVTALFLNKEGDILSASATQVKSIGVNDTSSFKIFFPTLSELSLEDTEFQTKVFTEVIPAL